jgi:hypothetical protein
VSCDATAPRSPLLLLEVAVRGCQSRPHQGKTRSEKEKSLSGLSSRSASSGRKRGCMVGQLRQWGSGVVCSCWACTAATPTLLLFSNQRRLEAAHASRPESHKLSSPSLFLPPLFLLHMASLLLLFLLHRGGTTRGGGLRHVRW